MARTSPELRTGSRTGFGILLVLSVVLVVYYGWSGRLEVRSAPDSVDYLEFPMASFSAAFTHIRTPGYPLYLKSVSSTVGLAWLPVTHWICWTMAVVLFYAALIRSRFRLSTALMASAVLLLSSSQAEFLPFILADSLAVSLAVVAVSGVIVWSSGEGRHRWLILSSLATFLGILVRPAFLFLVPWLPVCSLLLGWAMHRKVVWREVFGIRSVLATIAAVGPLLAYSSFRYLVVEEFGLVAFAGHNVIGIAGQALEREDVPWLPATVQETAQKILDARDSHPDYLPPINYEAMEKNYNIIIWQIAVPAARHSGLRDPMEIDQSLSLLARSLFRRHATFYLHWLFGNAKTAVRRTFEVVAHDLGLLIAVIAFLGCFVLSLLRGDRGGIESEHDPNSYCLQFWEQHGMLVVASTFAGLGTALIVAVETSLTRYLQATAVFFPCFLACLLWHTVERWNVRMLGEKQGIRH